MSFLVAGYLLTWAAVAGYAGRIEARAARAAERLEGPGPEAPGGREGSGAADRSAPQGGRPEPGPSTGRR